MMHGNGLLDDFKNVWTRPNNALIQIIIINLIVFLFINISGATLWLFNLDGYSSYLVRFFTMPGTLENLLYRPWTLITYFFTHTGFFHILFNMLFLYWFGKLVVEYLGARRFTAIYVLGGIAGGLIYLTLYNLIPRLSTFAPVSELIGASGAVYAVVVAAATLMPNYTFYLFLLGPVRIKYIALVGIILSYIQISGNPGGNFAHLAGALIGYLFIRQLQKGSDIGKPVYATLNFITGLFSKRSKIKVTYRKEEGGGYNNTAKRGKTDINPQSELDAILDKISARGYESLTKEEKQKLFNASKRS